MNTTTVNIAQATTKTEIEAQIAEVKAQLAETTVREIYTEVGLERYQLAMAIRFLNCQLSALENKLS